MKYNDHRNESGDWCPWSGRPVIAPSSDCDNYCPAMCPDSDHIPADALSDKDALDRITDVLSGQEWSADTPELIAEIVKLTGRVVRDLPEFEGDDAK